MTEEEYDKIGLVSIVVNILIMIIWVVVLTTYNVN